MERLRSSAKQVMLGSQERGWDAETMRNESSYRGDVRAEEKTEQSIEFVKEKGRQERRRKTHLEQQAKRMSTEKWEKCCNKDCRGRNNFDTCLGTEDCKYQGEDKKGRGT